jgi:hypothetical protein
LLLAVVPEEAEMEVAAEVQVVTELLLDQAIFQVEILQ